MREVSRIADLREAMAALREGGATVGLVPTMGALHAGHMALVEAAMAACDHAVVSIFVNPTQFAANEDIDRYPRQMERDRSLLERHGVSLLFAPTREDIYPPGHRTRVTVEGEDERLCGAHRPGHFTGVATVVSILIEAVRPDVSFFGEKDYQQLQVIRRMARDLLLPGEIRGVPTVRDADGLALSSRNAYLSREDRERAPGMYRTLVAIREAAAARPDDLPRLLEEGRTRLAAAGFAVEYLEARDDETLEPATRAAPSVRLFAAARLGETRLIDNLPLAD